MRFERDRNGNGCGCECEFWGLGMWGMGLQVQVLHKECLCVVYTEQFEYFMDKIRFRLPLVQYVH